MPACACALVTRHVDFKVQPRSSILFLQHYPEDSRPKMVRFCYYPVKCSLCFASCLRCATAVASVAAVVPSWSLLQKASSAAGRMAVGGESCGLENEHKFSDSRHGFLLPGCAPGAPRSFFGALVVSPIHHFWFWASMFKLHDPFCGRGC